MAKGSKARTAGSQPVRRSGRLAGDSPPPEEPARSVPPRGRKAGGSAPSSIETDESRLSSLTPSGDELPPRQDANEALEPADGVGAAGVQSPVAGRKSSNEEEVAVLTDERRARVFISVHTVDKAGKVISESTEEYALSTLSYSFAGGSNRVIDICAQVPHLFNSNSPLRNRTGRLKMAPRKGGRYRALGSLEKLIAGTASLEFASMGYLPISDADEDGHHHAELFLEEVIVPDSPAQAPAAKPAALPSIPVAPPKPNLLAPAVDGKFFIKTEPASIVDLTADSGVESDSPMPQQLSRATSSHTSSSSVEIVPFFKVRWGVEVATGKADRMSQVRDRIWPVVARVDKLKRTMSMKNRGGFEIPMSKEYPFDLQGRTLTQADLGRIYYDRSDTKFQEEFGMFITNVDRYPHVKAWLYEPTTAEYAAIFNHMKPVDFKEAFNANWPVWKKKKDEWMNAYEYAARRAERKRGPGERATASASSSPSPEPSSGNESGTSRKHGIRSTPLRKKKRISPSEDDDDDDDPGQRVRKYNYRLANMGQKTKLRLDG